MEIDSYFKLILLIGSALSLLVSIFLLTSSSKIFANKVLGTMNLLWSFIVFIFAMQSMEFYIKFPHLFIITSVIPLSLFPLLYIYIRSYLYDKKWSFWNFSVHFIPAVVFFIIISPFYFQTGEVKSRLLESGDVPEYIYTAKVIFDLVIILQGIFYTTLSMKLIQGFMNGSSKNISGNQLKVLNWLTFFVLSYIFLWAIGAIGAFLEMLNISVPFDLFNVFYLGLTILTLSIGFFALRQPEVLFKTVKPALAQTKTATKQDETSARTVHHEELQLILDYLEKEKAYLKNDLSMRDMVDATGLSKHRISELLNKELGKNFYEILNEYRTKEAIRLFNNGKHMNFTLTYIGEMAGFNSRATFNRIFKKITNQTPSEYIQSLYLRDENDHPDS